MRVDDERLRELFADPALGWITERLERRLRSGQPLTGTIVRYQPTAAERAAFNRLLGRSPSSSATLSLPLGGLEAILRHGELAADLPSAVAALIGPVIDEHRRRAELNAAWRQLFAELAEVDERPVVRAWLGERRTWILARRFAEHDPERGRELLTTALLIVERLPAAGVPLAELAAAVTGDSHALDLGQPLAALVISAAARFGGSDSWHGAEARRDVWAGVGVLIDELSAPVLVLNLRADERSLTGRSLNLHADTGEPCRLMTRQLLRHPPDFVRVERVHVCENPSVVAAATDRLGACSAPLVCIEGQPKTASRILLDRLAAAGIPLIYHGDFDWGGVRIANLVMARHGAGPWRFGATDYLAAVGSGGGKALTGTPVVASWDAELRTAMEGAEQAIFEEQVMNELIADLASR